jgi:hypothetical protein
LFEDQAVARGVSDLMLDIGERLNASLIEVQAKCNTVEAVRYHEVVDRIMGEIFVEVMNPIYAKHPELKPDELE